MSEVRAGCPNLTFLIHFPDCFTSCMEQSSSIRDCLSVTVQPTTPDICFICHADPTNLTIIDLWTFDKADPGRRVP